jgi:hypothetical protein
MKRILLICIFLAAIDVSAQKSIETTNEFTIEGQVKNRLSFSLKCLADFKVKNLDSLVIYNHLMESRKTIRHIKGVVLKDFIDKAVIEVESAKLLSEYYITCIASDNYKVFISWNEPYNSVVGESFTIVTEADGKTANQLEDRIALLSAADKATGRRYVKGLQKIIIDRVK